MDDEDNKQTSTPSVLCQQTQSDSPKQRNAVLDYRYNRMDGRLEGKVENID
jgi:hypothetical protein